MDSDVNYDALLALLPVNVRAYVLLALQFVAALLTFTSAVMPILEKIAARTATKKDDQALTAVQRVLSIIPRVQVPALSQRPPAPAPVKLDVSWPSADKVAAATASAAPAEVDDVSRAVVLPPADPPKVG